MNSIKNGAMTSAMTPFEGRPVKQIMTAHRPFPDDSPPDVLRRPRRPSARQRSGALRRLTLSPSILPVCRVDTLISRASIMRDPVASCPIIGFFFGLVNGKTGNSSHFSDFCGKSGKNRSAACTALRFSSMRRMRMELFSSCPDRRTCRPGRRSRTHSRCRAGWR